jgi:protein gp37
MSGKSSIEWTEATWNPLTGCTLVSEGCRNCYAARDAAGRLSHLPEYQGLAVKRGGRPVFTGEVRLHPDRLDQPLRWKRPRHVFVNSMSDLFHESVPFDFIDQVFAVMALAPQHTFQVLTKRPERMREYFRNVSEHEPVRMRVSGWMHVFDESMLESDRMGPEQWPLPNVWLGTSVEDQATADKRFPHLLATPAAVRFLSCEPLLGKVDLAKTVTEWMKTVPDTNREELHWVIVGGESGPRARPMHPDWARLLRDQCIVAGIPFFFKQWGEWECGPIVEDESILGGRAGLLACGQHRVSVKAIEKGIRLGSRFAVVGDHVAHRVGKKAAGRELDFEIWDEMPVVEGREL